MSARTQQTARSLTHHSFCGRLRGAVAAIMFLLGVLAASIGCNGSYDIENELMRSAEARYTAGDYDTAVDLYRRFIAEHPLSPFAPIAEQRLFTIERELDAVMGRRGGPAPIHVVSGRAGTSVETVTPSNETAR